MDRGARRATVHEVTRVGHNLVTKPPPPNINTFPELIKGEIQGKGEWIACNARYVRIGCFGAWSRVRQS